jgi:hypothetical protein
MKVRKQSANVEDRRDVHIAQPSLLDTVTSYVLDEPSKWMFNKFKNSIARYKDGKMPPSELYPKPPYFENKGDFEQPTLGMHLSGGTAPMPVGNNPQNSIAEFIDRLFKQMNTAKSADVPVTAEEAKALGIPVKQQPQQVPPNGQQPPQS